MIEVNIPPRLATTAELLCMGLPNNEIGRRMNIAPSTVQKYLSSLAEEFETSNRTETALKLVGYLK